MMRWTITTMVLLAAGMPMVLAGNVDDLVAQIGGNDEVARAQARQALRREDPVEAVHKLLPLVGRNETLVYWTAMHTISDIANDLSARGREAERAAVAAEMLALLDGDRTDEIKIRALRLVPVVVPAEFDVEPVAALLKNEALREKARTALEELGTPEARAALRSAIPKATGAFGVSIIDSLGTLQDEGFLAMALSLFNSHSPAARAATLRAVAWKGNPAHLEEAWQVIEKADEATQSDAIDATLRLVNSIAERGGNWSTAVAAYHRLLDSDDVSAIEGALAGLGRIGDGTCVGPVLAATRASQGDTRLIGLDALRTMQGVDVTRELVSAYANLPAELQLALIDVLGSRKHEMVAPILTAAAKSDNATMRRAGLAALGEAVLGESADILIAAAKNGDAEQKGVAVQALAVLSEGWREKHDAAQAGKAYLALYELADASDKPLRRQAARGIADYPTADAYNAVKAIAADAEMSDLTIRALLGVAGKLVESKQNEKALEIYEEVTRRNPGTDVMQQVVKGMAAAGAKVDLQGLLGVVTKWWLVGPFELGEENKGWDVAYVDEPDVNLVGRYMTGKRRVQWMPIVTDDPSGKVDLRKSVADTDMAIGYAYTEIIVSEPTDAVLLLGVDDSERVWVNGEKVFEVWTARGMTPDEDRVPVKLQAGTNRVLLKIWQHTLGWEFCMRITHPDGRPLQFTQPTE